MTERKPIVPTPKEELEKRALETVLVLGAGNFGCCLADHLADLGNKVLIFDKDQEIISGIQKTGRNMKFFPDLPLSKNLSAISELTPEIVKSASTIIYAIPTQVMRRVLATLPPLGLDESKLLIFVNKGIESGTGKLPDEIVGDVLGKPFERHAAFLSGPSFAEEVMHRLPTAVSVASHSPERATWCQRLFHAPHFRVYTTNDVKGVLVSGALKNVIAIASGIAAGRGLRNNTR